MSEEELVLTNQNFSINTGSKEINLVNDGANIPVIILLGLSLI